MPTTLVAQAAATTAASAPCMPSALPDEARERHRERGRQGDEDRGVLQTRAPSGQLSDDGEGEERRAADPQVIDQAPREAREQPFGQQVGLERARHRRGREHRIERGGEDGRGHGDDEQAALFEMAGVFGLNRRV